MGLVRSAEWFTRVLQPRLVFWSAVGLPGCVPALDRLEPGTETAAVTSSTSVAPETHLASSGLDSTSRREDSTRGESTGVSSEASSSREAESCSSCAEDASVGGNDTELSSSPDAGLAWMCTPGSYLGADDAGVVSCRPCEPGTFSSASNAGACTPHRVCDPGTFVESAGTAEMDAVCKACASGFFSDSVDATSCTEWTDCNPGQYVTRGGTAEEDRQCRDCADGETSTVVNSGACTAEGQCEAGTVQTAPATAQSAATCEACEPGNYCAGGDAPAVACDVDVLDDDDNPATPCVDKTICLTGQYVSDSGDATTDRTCAPCTSGFTDDTNATACTPWATCAKGTFVMAAGTPASDQVCVDCAEDQFSDTEDATTCQTWRTCLAPFTYADQAPSKTTDRSCAPCDAPKITLEDNADACQIVAFQMVGGQVAIEAEHYHAVTPSSDGHTWSLLALDGTSGDQCLELLPDNDSVWTSSPATTAPRLDYSVNFTQAGTFYVFVRGDTGAKALMTSDSCYAAIDGVATGTYTFVSVSNAWGWVSQTISVSTTGVHTLQILGREDGFRVDKIVVSAANTAPTGDGPAESTQQ